MRSTISSEMYEVIEQRQKFYIKYGTSDWSKIEPQLTIAEKQLWDDLDRELKALMVESLKAQGI